MTRKSIAILGGGIAALTTAYELAKAHRNYDITVYQMGWRLGGKGASGRNMDPAFGYRIEEHGLHMWSGLYENAFRLMHECYGLQGRPAGAPLASVADAFKPHSSFVLFEQYKGQWLPWPIQAPTNPEVPGKGPSTLSLTLWDYVGEALQLLLGQGKVDTPGGSFLHMLLSIVATSLALVALLIYKLARFLHTWSFVQALIVYCMRGFMHAFWLRVRQHLDHSPIRRAWLVANTAYANLHGALAANVISRGMDHLDEYDYRDWLSRYIYPDVVDGQSLTLASPLVQFLYDAQFSYLDGDLAKPDIGAGASLRTLIRMAFTCKGAILWRMQASMGDTVFTPLYHALREHGVKIAFFHQVQSLHLSGDKSRVDSIDLIVQADLRAPTAGYQPFIDVKGLACWPGKPLWDQLEGGDQLRLLDPPFESPEFKGGRKVTLRDGVDFDEVVYAMPIATIPHQASELLAANERWRLMLAHVKTVRTQAVQLWTTAAKGTLAVPGLDQPLVVTYHPTALNTMADMTFLTEREAWPAARGSYPLSQFYFCGPLAEGSAHQDHADAQVLANAEQLFGTLASPLFPCGTVPPSTQGAPFNWRLMLDPRGHPGHGQDRLKAQYLRANITPTERFTLTNSGSTKYRLKPSESGFANLKLAGDWTNNSFNLANIEATVMSGMLCAQAIAGIPTDAQIIGHGFGASKESAS